MKHPPATKFIQLLVALAIAYGLWVASWRPYPTSSRKKITRVPVLLGAQKYKLTEYVSSGLHYLCLYNYISHYQHQCSQHFQSGFNHWIDGTSGNSPVKLTTYLCWPSLLAIQLNIFIVHLHIIFVVIINLIKYRCH